MNLEEANIRDKSRAFADQRHVARSLAAMVLLVPVLIATIAGCASASVQAHRSATVTLTPTNALVANATTGEFKLTALDHGIRIVGQVRGLVPYSEHGLHLHEKSSCDDNGNAAGGHFNPQSSSHGQFAATPSHAGDLPSLIADAQGIASIKTDVHTLSIGAGRADDVIGRTVVVHRDRDDFVSQPAGNSGPRIACGMITLN